MVTYQKALVYTRLHSSEVQIWQLQLNASESEWTAFANLLSDDETQRTERFVFEKDRRSFAVCRGALRILLQDYLGQPAAGIAFTYSARGKPHLFFDTDLRFNVSHSGGLALFAFTRGCDLGVDVELVRRIKEIDGIAQRFFCPEECAELISLPPAERPEAFFRCWTRKEAYIKATGDGLSAPLDQFQVAFRTDEPASFVHINHNVGEASEWTLHNVILDSPYMGAAAYKAASKEVRMMERLSVTGLLKRIP